jgi:hypothetical protein
MLHAATTTHAHILTTNPAFVKLNQFKQKVTRSIAMHHSHSLSTVPLSGVSCPFSLSLWDRRVRVRGDRVWSRVVYIVMCVRGANSLPQEVFLFLFSLLGIRCSPRPHALCHGTHGSIPPRPIHLAECGVMRSLPPWIPPEWILSAARQRQRRKAVEIFFLNPLERRSAWIETDCNFGMQDFLLWGVEEGMSSARGSLIYCLLDTTDLAHDV